MADIIQIRRGTLANANLINPVLELAEIVLLVDGSNNFTGQLKVGNGTDDFTTLPLYAFGGGGGSSAWGAITGTLSAQTDLQNALDLKSEISKIQSGSCLFDIDSGTVNAYDITLTPPITAYAQGSIFFFLASSSNTGASTVEVNGLPAKPIVRRDGTALQANDIPAGSINIIADNGTNFQLLVSQSAGSTLASSVNVIPSGNQTETNAQTAIDSLQTKIDELVARTDLNYSEQEFNNSLQTSVDRGDGVFGMNNLDPQLVTELYFDNLTDQGSDMTSILDDLPIDSHIIATQKSNEAKRAVYKITAAATDETGFRKIEVSHVDSPTGESFDNGEVFIFAFIPSSASTVGNDTRIWVQFQKNQGTVRRVTLTTPVQVTPVIGNGFLSLGYETTPNDGNFNFTPRADINALNLFLASLPPLTQIVLQLPATMNWDDDLLLILNLS